MRPRSRYRPNACRAPSAPPEMKRRRLESVPTGANSFDWQAGELVRGPSSRRDGFWARLESLYGRSQPDGDDQSAAAASEGPEPRQSPSKRSAAR
jgi:hypothetical protein